MEARLERIPDEELSQLLGDADAVVLPFRQITTSGSAQPVALAIDGEDWPEVVGTIAGDDTVLIICPDLKRATQLRDRLETMIG